METSSFSLSSAAYDAQALNTLKYQVAQGSPAAIEETAKQMEGLFVQMMLKSMRSAFSQEGFLNNEQTQLYTSMYDQQIAQQMVAHKSLGIAELIVSQLRSETSPIPESVGSTALALEGGHIQSLPVRALEQLWHHSFPSLSTSSSVSLPRNGEFVTRLTVPAQLVSQRSGISHQLMMAQAALESGWGEYEIPTHTGGRSHNLFGIKAGKNWTGPTTEMTTTEYEQGMEVKTKAKFRVYDSYFAAMNDYANLLTQNPRYANVVAANTPEQAAHALQRAGYATDPNYANKLVQLMGQIKNEIVRAGQQMVKAYTYDLSKLF